MREHEGEPVPRLREQGGKARLRLVQALGERPVLPGRKARVVQAEERDLLSPARKRHPAVPEHLHAARGKARLQRGQVHSARLVVAGGVDRWRDLGELAGELQRKVQVRAAGVEEVPGDADEVGRGLAQGAQERGVPLPARLVVHVGDLAEDEPVKGGGDLFVPDLDPRVPDAGVGPGVAREQRREHRERQGGKHQRAHHPATSARPRGLALRSCLRLRTSRQARLASMSASSGPKTCVLYFSASTRKRRIML